MKNCLNAARAGAMIIILTMIITVSGVAAFAWEADGAIPGTWIEYSGLTVSRSGVSVRLTNTSPNDVNVSLRLTFFDRGGNSLGYSLFGLREIWAGESVTFSNNHLNGNWRACRDAPRINFSRMTYEYIYH